MPLEFRILRPGDEAMLRHCGPEVFDHPIDPQLTAEFLADPRHHLAVAIDDDGAIIAMASGVHYIHPDKPAEMWINEVGVASTHRGRGIGKRLVATLLDYARKLGCREAWVLTDRSNIAAMKLYAGAGGEATDQVMFNFRLDRIPD